MNSEIRPRHVSAIFHSKKEPSNPKNTEALLKQYRSLVRHLTKKFDDTEEDLDEYVGNWKECFAITTLNLSDVEDLDSYSARKPSSRRSSLSNMSIQKIKQHLIRSPSTEDLKKDLPPMDDKRSLLSISEDDVNEYNAARLPVH